MASAHSLDIRPRRAGEILDDAWGLYLADAPLLLALSSLFLAPAFLVSFWLLTRPVPQGLSQLLWPCVAALLLPLSGLGSGACQEVFRSRAEGKTPGLFACLAALQQGWNHAAARGCIFLAFFLGSWLIVMPGLAVLVSAAAVHPILAAGETSFFRALRTATQESQRQPGKTAAVVLCRIPLALFAAINLFLAIRLGFWTADHLGGFDLARIELFFSLTNPVYLTALLMLSWMLLAPYAEAANYLLHVDARARYEGLDLWYRRDVARRPSS